jgi:hypothetical protein
MICHCTGFIQKRGGRERGRDVNDEVVCGKKWLTYFKVLL